MITTITVTTKNINGQLLESIIANTIVIINIKADNIMAYGIRPVGLPLPHRQNVFIAFIITFAI